MAPIDATFDANDEATYGAKRVAIAAMWQHLLWPKTLDKKMYFHVNISFC